MCLPAVGASCTVALPALMPREHSSVFLVAANPTEESSGDACAGDVLAAGAMSPQLGEGKPLEFVFDYANWGESGSVLQKFVICWTYGAEAVALPLAAGEDAAPSKVSEKNFPIGALRYMGPSGTSPLATTRLFVGEEPAVQLEILGVTEDLILSGALPEQMKQIRLTGGQCEATLSETDLLLHLYAWGDSGGLRDADFGGLGRKRLLTLTKRSLFFARAPEPSSPLLSGRTDTKAAIYKGRGVLNVPLELGEEQEKRLTVCWCQSDSACLLTEDYSIPVISVAVHGPAFGVHHSCVHDTTCLMAIDDALAVDETRPRHSLLIRTDCAGTLLNALSHSGAPHV